MMLFSIWMYFVTFYWTSYVSILIYVYASLQVTKVPAEAMVKHAQYCLAEGVLIAFAWHTLVIILITISPYGPLFRYLAAK